ncbi:MAG: tetratricopeptide repeat protein [Elusimicrobia bacterium]|nr:tetratricopeptide repeat protein [Elusimicrobiota bacterium]
MAKKKPRDRKLRDKGIFTGRSGELNKTARRSRGAPGVCKKTIGSSGHAPDDGRYFYDLACRLKDEGRLKEALGEMEKALVKGFTGPEIRNSMAGICFELGMYDRAFEEYREALSLDDGGGRTHAELARIYIKREDFSSAVKEYKTAIRKGWDNADVRRDIGKIYQSGGKYGPAEEEFLKALEFEPENGEINAEMGWLYRDMQDLASMEKHLEEAIRKGYSTPDVHRDLGKAYYLQGKHCMSVREIGKVLDFSPGDSESCDILSRIFRERRGDPGAVEELENSAEEALMKSNDDPAALYELGNISMLKNKFDRAVHYYRRACSAGRDFMLPRVELARCFLNRGMVHSAEEELKIIADNAQDPQTRTAALGELGRLYRLRNDSDRISRLREIAKKIGKNREVLRTSIRHYAELGKIYRSLGLKRLSCGVFRELMGMGEVTGDRFVFNQMLNEFEISERREILESRVRVMIAMIINRCNLKCRMCGVWKKDWQAREGTMREIVDLFPYMEEVNWQGGEVFLIKGFADILEEGARYANLRQIVYTNGLLINESILYKLEKGKVSIVFSIDSPVEEVYEHIRKGASFKKLKRVLSLVKEFREKRNSSDIRIYLNPVIMRSNYTHLEGFVDFAKQYGFDMVTFHPIRGDYAEENIFSPGDEKILAHIRKNMPAVIRKAAESGVNLNNWLPIYCGSSRGDIDKAVHGAVRGRIDDMICYAPWQKLLLDCGGAVRPASLCLKKNIGSIDTMSIDDIWNGEGMRYYRRKLAGHDFRDLAQPECMSGQIREKLCEAS